MIYIKCRLITGIIKKILTTVFKAIYKVLSVFNLQPLLFVLVVFLILLLTGTLGENPTVKTTFIVFIVLSAVYAVIATLYKLFSLGKKKGKKVQIIDNRPEEYRAAGNERQYDDGAKNVSENYTERQENVYTQTDTSGGCVGYNNGVGYNDGGNQKAEAAYPKYFTVRQNPNYFFAEYDDRYELYFKSHSGVKHVRTDRKY